MNRHKKLILLNLILAIFFLAIIISLSTFLVIANSNNNIYNDLSRILNVVLPPGWNWTIILLVSIIGISVIFFINILIIYIIKMKNKKQLLFALAENANEDNELEYENLNEQNNIQPQLNQVQQPISLNLNQIKEATINQNDVSDYIVYNSNYKKNISKSPRVFVDYKSNLRDEYLYNNWWFY